MILLREEGIEEVVVVVVEERVVVANADDWFENQIVSKVDPEAEEEVVFGCSALPYCAIAVELERNLVELKDVVHCVLCRHDVHAVAGTNLQRVVVNLAVGEVESGVLGTRNDASGVVMIDVDSRGARFVEDLDRMH